MSFYWVHVLWSLFIPGILALWEARRRVFDAQNEHPKIVRADAGTTTLQLQTETTPFRKRAPHWRLFLGLAFAIIAIARPQWGRLDEPVFDQSREIMIALDLSRSMLAADVRPTRLDRAKLLVTSLLQRLSGERVGLIVFSGTAFLQSPLSSDYEILNEFLPALTPDYLPEGGTNYEELINTALGGFSASSSADRYLIILSDGEATDESWKAAAQKLKDKGIRVIGLGIGTAEGAMLPETGGGFIKDERGAVVLSKIEPATLKDLAQLTHGTYADASTWVDLAQLLQATVESGQKGKFREERNLRLVERYQWALTPAFLLFLWSFWQEFPVYPRSRDMKLQGNARPPSLPTSSGLPPLPPALPRAVVPLIALLFGFWAFGPFARALDAIPTPQPNSPPRTANGGEPEAKEADVTAAPLSHLVSQFSARDSLTAHEYAELAQTTVTYGDRIREQHQPLPEGPIHDGLTAVEAGRALDPHAADWNKLQDHLTQLLQAPPPTPTPPPQDQKQNQSQKDQSKSDQSKDDSSKKDQSKSDSSPAKSSAKKSSETPGGTPTPSPSEQNSAEKKNDPSARLGDMTKAPGEKPTPAPTPNSASPETQKVGGAQDTTEQVDKSADPSLAVPLQRLQQVKDGDSPIKIQQIIRGDKKTPTKPGKNW